LVADLELFEKGMLERRRMDDARRRVNTLEALLEEAESALELAQVRLGWTRATAPFTGYVQKNVVLQGEQVAPGAAMVELVAAQPLKVIVPVAESDLNRLAENQPASVYLPALRRHMETRVHRIYRALDSRSRNATVELALPPGLGAARPGMTAEVRLLVEFAPAVLAVPHQAVRLQGTQTGVFVAESGVAQWRQVSTGASQSGEIVLLEGVNAGESVIITPHPGLVQGRTVKATTGKAEELEQALP
jgi:RND family efflux transporter MFP subunit